MNTAWMVVLVMVLGGGKAPETQVVVQGIVDQKECNFRATTLNDQPPATVDAATGRPILSRTYVCTPVSPADLQRDLDKLKK